MAQNESSMNENCHPLHGWAHPAKAAQCQDVKDCSLISPCSEEKGEERDAEKEESEESLSRIALGSIRKQTPLALTLKGRITEGSGLSLSGQGLLLPLYSKCRVETLAQ